MSYTSPILLNIMFHPPMGRFQLELINLPIFPPSSHSIVVFLSCRPFVVNATFLTGLVGCLSYAERKTQLLNGTTVEK